ncbi:hypothetical protein DUI87_11122 [Hirundo rustica rustica]|uniref:Murine leukemia virus integrase C-terminal domain-containing protein n=1 Tax=Hirundo rustica rustica TaxID=333673 RepID=A0A3M0KFI5_HIRRU|nr:hypothetical protein DUI87_11122 [Hirundo rustica rustica]
MGSSGSKPGRAPMEGSTGSSAGTDPTFGLCCSQHPIGDWVLVKERKEAPLVAKWRGPFQVLLTTETAVKTAEHRWSHHIRVKVSEAPEIWTSQLEEKGGKPRLTLHRSGLEQ